jgi:hypothetical protein
VVFSIDREAATKTRRPSRTRSRPPAAPRLPKRRPPPSTTRTAAPYGSLRGLLAHLGTLTRNQVRFAGTPATVLVLTEPTSEQRQAFDLIGAPIPPAST